MMLIAGASVVGHRHGAPDPEAIDESHQEKDQELRETDGGQLDGAQPADHQGIDDPDTALEQVAAGDRQGKADESGKERLVRRSGGRPHSLCQSHWGVRRSA
jgi:hypothetical protein